MDEQRHGMDGHRHGQRPASVVTGNPRVTVAFPFSTIRIQEPGQELRELAGLVDRLAGQVALLAAEVSVEQAAPVAELAEEAAALAARLAQR